MKKLKIYFTSDLHGYFYPTTYGDRQNKNVGLFGSASKFVKDDDTLIIDGGDILQGSAFVYYAHQIQKSPKIIADIMNDVGYDFYTIGNHDFNYGMDYQNEYHANTNATCVCQNVVYDNGDSVFPYVIKKMPNGLKVALIGAVTDFVNVWEKEEHLKGVKVVDPFESMKKALEDVKGKADITVGIYHGGYENDLETGRVLSKTKENLACKICKELDFDILLTGHQHMSVEGRDFYGTYTLQPSENGKDVQYLELTIDDNNNKTYKSQIMHPNANCLGAIADKYMDKEEEIQKWLDLPVGHLSKDLMPKDKLTMAMNGSIIADFFNKVQLYYSHADISVVGLANDIAGFHKEVTTRDIIATYPYPNTLVVCKINGEQLKRALERTAEYFDHDENGNIVISKAFLEPKVEHYNYDYYDGIDYKFDYEKPFGERVVSLKRNGQEINPNDEFTLCLNNYRFSGAGGYEVYNECESIREINIEMVELIMDYFHENPIVDM